MEMDLETVSFFVGHIQERIATGGAFFSINCYEKKTRLASSLATTRPESGTGWITDAPRPRA